MEHGIITMDEAIANGISPRRVYRLVQKGTWLQLYRGIYLPLQPRRKGASVSEAVQDDLLQANAQTITEYENNTKPPPESSIHRKTKLPSARIEAIEPVTVDPTIEADVFKGRFGRQEVDEGPSTESAPTTQRTRLARKAYGEDRFWKACLCAQLYLGGPGSMVSHRAAAKLHNLEGIRGYPIEITIPHDAPHRPPGSHRSTVIDTNTVLLDGLTSTTLVRTLIDLANVCTLEQIEQALESALRGPDRRRPDLWNTQLLTELRQATQANPRRPGNFLLRTVLNRRTTQDRPTGSLPETILWQALYRIGITAVRQPSLYIVDESGRQLDVFFPDLALPTLRLLVEIDGLSAHSSQQSLARDLHRQNKLTSGFVILRFTAAEIFQDPDRIAEQIRRATLRLEVLPNAWTIGGVTVSYSTNEFTVVDSTR